MDMYMDNLQRDDVVWFVVITVLFIILKMGLDRLGIFLFPKIVAKMVYGTEDYSGPEKAFRHVYRVKITEVLNKYVYTIIGAITISTLVVFLEDIRYIIAYFLFVLLIHIIYTYRLYLRTK